MTLIATWVRCTPGAKELIVASDSRISGGVTLDHAPKIFRLERNDAVLAYCGSTLVAYPLILQIKAALDGYDEIRNRVVDIVKLKHHIEKIIERQRHTITFCLGEKNTVTNFKILLAGYSWLCNDFRAWVFKFDMSTGEFSGSKVIHKKQYFFMSDVIENEQKAKANLKRHMELRSSEGSRENRLNWEPLSVLINQIENQEIHDIGGPPQLIKIYKHSNTMPLNVLWPVVSCENSIKKTDYRLTFLGRILLDYERSRYLTIDPQSYEIIEPWHVEKAINKKNLLANRIEKKRHQQILVNQLSGLANKKKKQFLLTQLIGIGYTFEQLKPHL